METTDILLLINLFGTLILVLFVMRNPSREASAVLLEKIKQLETALGKIEANLKEDFRINREENGRASQANREELTRNLTSFRKETMESLQMLSQQNVQALEKLHQTLEQKVTALVEKTGSSFKDFSAINHTQLEKIETQVAARLQALNEQAKQDHHLMRDAMARSIKDFQEGFDKNVQSFNTLQREKFEQLVSKQSELVQGTAEKLESIRGTVEEKLEKTLSERLGQSFETVGKQLIEVQKGLGEMQTIAADVGGLKKVLSNVKLRGGVGEVQLALLLEQILAPSQYEANVRTKTGSSDAVEFAIKLPGRSADEKSFVYLPIDAKFPKETYENLLLAYENGDPEPIELAAKTLESTIKKMAKDIHDKYIDPPGTTDFAILFLPFESIYAEVIRRSALVDQLRDQYKITVAGPTTLVAILNSLQMGFRTLALQKRSGEVWKVLSTVKSEFAKFGGLLERAQKNFQTGMGQLDEVVGTRTRAIQRQLREVEALPEPELHRPEALIESDPSAKNLDAD